MKITSRKITWPDGTVTETVRSRPLGLGDAVAAVAQPIARGIDAVLGTKVAKCGGCKDRRDRLNALVPNVGLKSDSPPEQKPFTP